MNRSFVFLADGFEEVEAITPVDVMRRAGMDVKTVSVMPDKRVRGANGVEVVADFAFAEVGFADAEWLVLPGGMPGATNLAASKPLCDLLMAHAEAGGKIAAICASPAVVLAPLGLLRGKEATCYPSFEHGLEAGGAEYRDRRVVALDKVITANGPSSALLFALAIVANSMGEHVALQVGSGMLLYQQPTDFRF